MILYKLYKFADVNDASCKCLLQELCFRGENLLRKYFLIILNYNSQTQFIL